MELISTHTKNLRKSKVLKNDIGDSINDNLSLKENYDLI